MKRASLAWTPALVAMLFFGGAVCRPTVERVTDQAPVPVQQDDLADAGPEPSCEIEPPLPPPPPKRLPRKVLIVGDSEACAVAVHLQPVADAVDDALSLPHDETSSACKGGSTVQYWGTQGHLREALDRKFQPDVIVVFLGTNHFGSTTTPPVGPILTLIKQRGLTCVWVGNTAVRGQRWPINDLLRNAVTSTCSYFDTEEYGLQLVDGTHPGKVAAAAWLEAVWRIIPPKNEETDGR